MANPFSVFKGVVRGKTIELESEPGLPEGQEVTVTVKPVVVPDPSAPPPFSAESQRRWEEAWAQVKDLPPGEGLRRSAGGWAEDAEELDQYLEWARQQRRGDRREHEP